MTQPTPDQIRDERNKRLLAWVADNLGLEGAYRRDLYLEMAPLFKHASDETLATLIRKTLAANNIVVTIESASTAITRFHDIARGWLGAAPDQKE